MNDKKTYLWGLITGALLAATVVATALLVKNLYILSGGSSNIERPAGPSQLNGTTLSKLKMIEKVIQENYALDIPDGATLEDGAFKGLVKALDDPYSTYYSEWEMKQQQDRMDGVYYGIGAVFSKDEQTGYGLIKEVYRDSPAQKAGLLEGDLIKKVDGTKIKDMELSEVTSIVRGDEGTKVVLTLDRRTDKGVQELDVTITRGSVPKQTVRYEMMDEGMGYIRISEFDAVTVDQFIEALATLKGQDMRGLVLDLRENGGGNLAAAVDIAGHILPEGIVTYTLTKSGERSDYKSDGKHELKLPMVLLVNKNSASASEILAGAIKDYKKAVLVGETTYGKGIVQRYIGLSDGSAVKLTTSKYYTPNGENIHGIGIEPDVAVEITPKDIENLYDSQLEAAKRELRKQI